jgi:hypothetical protein
MLLVAELFIILLFLVICLTYSFYSKQRQYSVVFKYIFFFFSFVIFFFYIPYQATMFKYTYYFIFFRIQDIIPSDLFFFFQYFFIDFYLSIYYISLILTFFSIFFICFYYILKQTQQQSKIKVDTFQILRNQNIIKQRTFKTQIRIFQK